jgi:hypothetical protein
MNTTFTRNYRGEAEVLTTIPLSNGMQLRIFTAKRAFGKGVQTTASAVTPDPTTPGCYSFKIPGDYMARLVVDTECRATEKNLRGQHAAALEIRLESTLLAVEQFYGLTEKAAA